MTIKKFILTVFSFVLHCAGIAVIFYFIIPIARWYLSQSPAKGVDMWLSGTFVSKLMTDFNFPFQKWRDYSYGGDPFPYVYPFLYFYLMVPFAKAYGILKGIQVFAIAGLFSFAAFSYLLYYRLSKNRVLSGLLVLTTVYSANLYRALVWAGGIPFWTTQSFYPVVLLCVVLFCQKNNYKWLYLGAALTGLGIMGHPQGFLNLIVPASVALIVFWREKSRVSVLRRFLDLFKFGVVSYLVALPEMFHLYTPAFFWGLLKGMLARPATTDAPSSTGGAGGISPDVLEWTRNQFYVIFTETNIMLWYLLVTALVLFAISLFFRKNRLKVLVSFFPFFAIALYTVGTIYLMSRGMNMFIGGWYKAFWLVLPGMATLTAFAWGESGKVLEERLIFKKKLVVVSRWIAVAAVNLILIGLGYVYLVPSQGEFFKKLVINSNSSSAYPDVLNIPLSAGELDTLGQKIKPKIMSDNSRDYRLYVIDATVNIWWPAVEQVPLTRGYVDPALGAPERGSIFWLDAALGPGSETNESSLVADWHTPQDVADNNLKFLLDWSATKYLEGNHQSANNSTFAENSVSDKFIGSQEKVTLAGGIVNRYQAGESWSDEITEDLNFYRVKDDLVTPLFMATNASPVLHIGDDQGYDILTRFLGLLNLGPRQIVLSRGPKYLDDISLNELADFDAVIIYRYDYHNRDKAWNTIAKYVAKGGKVFVDTGPEGRDSDTVKYYAQLPGLFPIKNTIRDDLGKDWSYWYDKVPLTRGVKFNQFTKLDFDGNPWNISHPADPNDLRENARVVLKQKNFPVVVDGTYGDGRVIWSGLNLPYHLIRDYNWQEANFFKNIISEMADINGGLVDTKTSWVSPELRLAEIPQAKGIILKENAYDGWKATVNGRSKQIYRVGPSYPGYIYVRLREGDTGSQLKLSYHGSWTEKIYYIISLIAILFVLDHFLGNKIIVKPLSKVASPLLRNNKQWLGKEDDY